MVRYECNDFKLKISDFLLNLFKQNLLLNNNNLNDLSNILLKFLNSFKKFSSLIDLKINENENLIENLINLWNLKYIEILEKNLLKFNNIKLIINQNFLNNNINDFKNILINKNNNPLLSIGNNLFQITELSKINDYIINLQSSNDQHSSTTPTTTITASTIISNEELLSNINIYKSILNSSFKSIQLISKLSSTISKPILSIDDYEDDEYWENISLKLISITNNLIEFNINNINESIKLFITDINNDINYFENSNANTKNANENSKLYLLKLFYLIKILISLISNLNISSILFKFKNSFINNKKTNEINNKNFEIEIVNFNDILYPILLKLFEILTDILSTSSLENLKNIIKSRLSTSNKYTEIEEKILWDGFINSSSSSSSLDNTTDYSTLLPNCNSIDVECLLFELANNFKSGGKILNFTEGEDEEEESEEIFDFTDIYLINEFKQANKELIRKLVKSITDGIDEKDDSIKDITFESVENTETESDEITKPDENTEDNSTTATTTDAEVDTDTGTGAGANKNP
ncbi:unnamed protein product [[Candida] boidinii]|nr:unnamed protein product [[Candida] boidinii]